MGSLVKRGRIYYLKYYLNGKQVWISTKSSNKAVAEEILKKKEKDIALGLHGIDPKKSNIPFDDFTEKYYSVVGGSLKASTLKMKRYYFKVFSTFVKGLSLQDINTQHIDRWKSAQIAAGKSLATVSIECRAIKALFSKAVLWKYIQENPISFDTIPKVKKKDFAMEECDLKKVFETILNDIVAENNPKTKAQKIKLYDFYRFLLSTGLRRSDALGIKPENINFEKQRLQITQMKTGEPLSISLGDEAIIILRKYENGFFSDFKPQYVTKMFQYYLGEAKLKGFKLHSLRHTNITLKSDAGISLATIQQGAGHADMKTTLGYITVRPAKSMEASKKIEEKMRDLGIVQNSSSVTESKILYAKYAQN